MWSFLFLISTCLLGACWGQPELSCLYSLICTSVPKLMQRQRACPRSHSYRLAQIIPVFSASGLSLRAKCPLTAPTGISLCESIQRSCHGLPHSRISYFPSLSQLMHFCSVTSISLQSVEDLWESWICIILLILRRKIFV